jgi:hypothetical protein
MAGLFQQHGGADADDNEVDDSDPAVLANDNEVEERRRATDARMQHAHDGRPGISAARQGEWPSWARELFQSLPEDIGKGCDEDERVTKDAIVGYEDAVGSYAGYPDDPLSEVRSTALGVFGWATRGKAVLNARRVEYNKLVGEIRQLRQGSLYRKHCELSLQRLKSKRCRHADFVADVRSILAEAAVYDDDGNPLADCPSNTRMLYDRDGDPLCPPGCYLCPSVNPFTHAERYPDRPLPPGLPRGGLTPHDSFLAETLAAAYAHTWDLDDFISDDLELRRQLHDAQEATDAAELRDLCRREALGYSASEWDALLHGGGASLLPPAAR